MGLRFGRHIVKLLGQEPANHHLHLAGVCDLDAALVTEVSESLGIKGYKSLDEVLKADSNSIIGLFTPPKGRAQLVRKLIRAGRDVLTTKPFELDPAEAQAVLEEARSLGRIVHMNSPASTLPQDLRLIDEWRTKHDLGRPVGGSARVWAPYHEKADGSWLDDPEACPAAPLFRLGIYLFNDFCQIFGPAQELQLMTSSIRTGRPTPDNAQVNIKYRNGALGQVYASFCVQDGDHYRNSMTLNFENGTIYRNAGGVTTSTKRHSSEITLVKAKDNHRLVVEHVEIEENGSSGQYQWDVLADAVRHRKLATDETIFNVTEGIRVIDAMKRAQKTGFSQV